MLPNPMPRILTIVVEFNGLTSLIFLLHCSTSNTWEPISNLTGCSEMLEAFEAKLTSKGPESTAVKDRKRSTFENDSEGGDSSSVYDSDVDIGKNESKSNSIVS